MINKKLKINNPNRSWKLSDETRKRQSDAKKNQPPVSDETRAKLSLSHKGKTSYWKGKKRPNLFNEESKKKLSEIMKNQWKNGTLKGHSQSEETRRKIGLKTSINFLGENNPAWKGGITPINYKIRNSPEYKLWRRSVFERDHFTCIWCGYKSKGSKPSDIHADHIKRFSDFPELRFAIDNGRTLCVDCHKTTETYGNKKINNFDTN